MTPKKNSKSLNNGLYFSEQDFDSHVINKVASFSVKNLAASVSFSVRASSRRYTKIIIHTSPENWHQQILFYKKLLEGYNILVKKDEYFFDLPDQIQISLIKYDQHFKSKKITLCRQAASLELYLKNNSSLQLWLRLNSASKKSSSAESDYYKVKDADGNAIRLHVCHSESTNTSSFVKHAILQKRLKQIKNAQKKRDSMIFSGKNRTFSEIDDASSQNTTPKSKTKMDRFVSETGLFTPGRSASAMLSPPDKIVKIERSTSQQVSTNTPDRRKRRRSSRFDSLLNIYKTASPSMRRMAIV